MTDVRRFTTDYVPVEDRMRLSVEREDGHVQVLWLTRPLLNKLVKQLLGFMSSAPLPGDGGQSIKAIAHQRFNQQAAESALQPQKPVRAGASAKPAGKPVLITTIALRHRQGVIHIEFNEGQRVVQSIPFNKEAMRQWLGVLHKQYNQAAWDGTLWPDWMSSGQSPKAPTHIN